MAITRMIVAPVGCASGLLCLVAGSAPADDLTPLRVDLARALPQQELETLFGAPPPVLRGGPPRGPLYRSNTLRLYGVRPAWSAGAPRPAPPSFTASVSTVSC